MSTQLSVEQATGESLPAVWNRCSEIMLGMKFPSFFCSGDWLRSVAAETDSSALAVFIVKARDVVVAVLPLQRKRNVFGGYDYQFLGSDFYPDPLGLIVDAANLEESIAALKAYFAKATFWDRVRFDWMFEAESRSWSETSRPQTVEPYLELPSDFDELLKSFKKKKRYKLRAAAKAVFDKGGVFISAETPDEKANLLESLFELHGKRADERSLDSSFAGSRVESLHRRLVQSSPSVRLFGLKLNGKFIAAIYGFEHANKFLYYQVAHDPEYGDLSPGSVLLYLVIQDSCQRNLKEFNFLQGDEGYKKIWATGTRQLYSAVLANSTWRASVLGQLDNGKRKMKVYFKNVKAKAGS